MRQLRNLNDPGLKYLKIDSLIQAQEDLPYIVGDSCHFLFRGVASDIAVSGEFNQWAATDVIMTREPQTDFWHASLQFEPDARLGYKYILDWSNWIIDPLNANVIIEEDGTNSELSMPAYTQPWEIESYPDVPTGMIEQQALFSDKTLLEYDLLIYLPNGYDQNRPEGYPVVFFQDGQRYLDLGHARNVLDNLIDSTMIQELIAVFIVPNDREEEFAQSKRLEYIQFMTEELVPFVDANYNTIPQARYRALIGNTLGGNISAITAYEHSDMFEGCGLHSPDLSPNSFEAFLLFQDNPAHDIRVAINWGSYDELASSLPLFRNVLQDKGYSFIAEQRPEGHSYGLWRATIDDFLIFFFPPDIVNSVPNRPNHSKIRIAPNPAGDHISVITDQGFDRLLIQDLSGRRLIAITGGTQRDINISGLASGYYFLSITGATGTACVPFIKQ